MECSYEAVENGNLTERKTREWIPLLRQIHICSGVWMMFYITGICVGAPTVLIPQLRTDGDHVVDDELASWIYSISNIAAIPWVVVLPSFTRYTGRKPSYILACISITSVFIIMYFSTSPYQILTALAIQGFVNATNIAIMTLILKEYSSPKYRGIFMNVTTASYFCGVWTSNAIGTYFYWKYISILGALCSAYTFTVAFCPESPVWLASKGRYKKSEEVFKWLNGQNEQSMKELREFIKSLKDYNDSLDNESKTSLMLIIKRKEFYKPLLLCFLIHAQYNFSGKNVCSICAIEVLSKMTASDEAAHVGMLILDGITILGMFLGAFLSKVLKRRTLYFSSCFIGVFFLVLISLNSYLVKSGILAENNVVAIALLVLYSLSISCGSMIMCIAMYCEIIPIRYQTSIYILSSLLLFGITSVMLKLTPMAVSSLGIDGTFFSCAVMCGAVTFILYFYLPETKGKTLLEIEKYFKEDNSKLLN